MYQHSTRELANRLDDLATTSISNSAIPIITRSGIAVGHYHIRIEDGKFSVKKRKSIIYTTHTKTAALIIAGILNKQHKPEDIVRVLQADYVIYSTKNDLESFKHHYDLAIKSNDPIKEGIMLSRFEQADDRYQVAKQILKQSYSKLF
jgi:mannose-1-phosphate guanylyltransferase